MKLFDVLKKIFNVNTVDEISEETIDNYYADLEKSEEKVEETTEVKEEVVENAEPVTETETEKVEEQPTETEETEEAAVVENAEPVVEEQPTETEKVEEEKKEEEVLTKEVINSSKGTVPMSKADIMELHGDQFFTALYKNRKNLM